MAFLFSLLCSIAASAQFELQWNADVHLELTTVGSDSDYFYNEISRRHRGLNFDLAQANAMATAKFGKNWAVNAQVQLERKYGLRAGLFREFDFYDVLIPRLNVEWTANNPAWKMLAGRVITPFGKFYAQQNFTERDLLQTPLAYSYYTNVSETVGLVDSLGEVYRENRDWGTPLLYRLGYTNGVQWMYQLPERFSCSVSLTSLPPNVTDDQLFSSRWSVMSRVTYKPAYFLDLGASFSYSPFLKRAEWNTELEDLSGFYQTLAGFDFQLGLGYFEWSGEVISAWYKVPVFKVEEDIYAPEEDNPIDQIFSIAAYTDLKYEFPFLPGAYAVYRFDILDFNKTINAEEEEINWDDRVVRHALGFGYKVNAYWDIKCAVATQEVAGRDWDLSMFRLMNSFHW